MKPDQPRADEETNQQEKYLENDVLSTLKFILIVVVANSIITDVLLLIDDDSALGRASRWN